MNDAEFLHWIYERIIHVYGESPNVDFLIRFRKILASTEDVQKHEHSAKCHQLGCDFSDLPQG